MSFRTIIISSRAKLETKMNYLIVRGEKDQRVHLSEIHTIIVDSTAVAITGSLLCEIEKYKIKIVFCDEKHNPHSELVPYFGSHDTSEKLKLQTAWTEERKALIWQDVIKLKIKKQYEHLNSLGLSEAILLAQYINEVDVGDKTNREGHSAKVYFNALFGKNFTRTSQSQINSFLNYGYAILLSAFNREVLSNGYITQLGIFHRNEYNKFNLSCDLMEPFRVIVDKAVMGMVDQEFDREQRLKLINILNLEVEIDGKKQFLTNAIKIYSKSVFDALSDKKIDIKEYHEL